MTTENNGLQKCPTCKCTVLLKYFSKNKKGELKKTCDTCLEKNKIYRGNNKINRKIYYENNKEHMNNQSKIRRDNNKDEIKKKNKEYREINKEHIKERKKIYSNNHKEEEKIYRENNKEHLKELKKKWDMNNKENNKEKRNIYQKNKKNTDVNYRVLCNLRSRLWQAVKKNTKSASTKTLLGCTSDELKIHLENKFTDGMNWDNYGNEWHIDHIIPCCSFDMSSSDKQKECFHFSNLQPLWALDNMIKGGRILLEEGDILDEIRIISDI
jgi:hypothetical protein